MLSTCVEEDGKWVVCMGTDAMVSTELQEDDTLVMDGNPSHITIGTIVILGKVSNARTNPAHSFVPICVGAISTGEHSSGIRNFILQVVRLRDKPFETNLWRVDGHMGLRNGIMEGVRDARVMFGVPPCEAKVAMDNFHMTKSVATQNKLLMGKQLEAAIHEIRQLSEVPERLFAKAYRAVKAKWESRVGWRQFIDYFHDTYCVGLKGWWVIIGEGTPRTTGAEGRWPTIHNLMGGKHVPQLAITSFVDTVCTYLQTNLSATPRLRSQQTDVAVELTLASGDTLRAKMVENDGVWYFCKRRYLSRAVRPTITEVEIDNYFFSG